MQVSLDLLERNKGAVSAHASIAAVSWVPRAVILADYDEDANLNDEYLAARVLF